MKEIISCFECRLCREILKFKVRNEKKWSARFKEKDEKRVVQSLSLFIKERILNEIFRVIKVDHSLLDYYQKLTTLCEFRSIGVNYNQTVVVSKSDFTEKKAFAMLAKLEKLTLELAISEVKSRENP